MSSIFHYEEWHPIRWETPISNGTLHTPMVVGGDALDPLVILCILSMTSQPSAEQCWSLSFDPAIAWMVRPETYTTGIAQYHTDGSLCARTGKPLGNAWVIPGSPWIEALCHDEPSILDLNNAVEHYQIGGSSFIIDIASRVEPVFAPVRIGSVDSFVERITTFFGAKDSET